MHRLSQPFPHLSSQLDHMPLPFPPLPPSLPPSLIHVLCSYGTERFTPLSQLMILDVFVLLGKASPLFLIWTTPIHVSRSMSYVTSRTHFSILLIRVTHFLPSASMKLNSFLYSCTFSYYIFMCWFLLQYV